MMMFRWRNKSNLLVTNFIIDEVHIYSGGLSYVVVFIGKFINTIAFSTIRPQVGRDYMDGKGFLFQNHPI